MTHTASIRALAVLLIGATIIQVTAAHAAKPPPAPTATPAPLDGGTIYYHEQGVAIPAPVHRLDPDGSDDRTLVGVAGSGGLRPSRLLHNGARWFVRAQDVSGSAYFPDGSRRFEIFATYEGSPSPLQLTDNAGQCISMAGPRGVFLDWAPAASGQVDGALAWVGKRWADAGDGGSPCDTLSATGIFRAALAFDGAGNVTGLAAQPTAPEFVVNADTFTFRPDGQQIAYASSNTLYLAPDPTGLNPLNGGNYGAEPAWSPDGAKIAFHGSTDSVGGQYATFSINPNDTGLTLLAQGRRSRRSSQTSLIHLGVRWSPSGSHLVFTEKEVNELTLATLAFRVRRMTASGGGNTVLPTAGPLGGFALGWGQD